MRLLAETGESLVGKHAVVIGQSNIVGRPMALELLMARCTVTICHSATRDLPSLVRQADIVVAAIGKPRFVQGDWIKPGAIVDRRRHQSRRRRQARRRRRVRRCARACRLDHAGAGRRRADDDRDAAREHAARRAIAGRRPCEGIACDEVPLAGDARCGCWRCRRWSPRTSGGSGARRKAPSGIRASRC